jgi:hypothetical protein
MLLTNSPNTTKKFLKTFLLEKLSKYIVWRRPTRSKTLFSKVMEMVARHKLVQKDKK